MPEPSPDWTAVILAGGRSTRLGQDKAQAVVKGRTLLDHVVAGVPDDVTCIVVGPPPTSAMRLLLVAIEEEPDGGPVAGVACGIAFVTTPVVVILAVDMPFAADVVPQLLAALDDAEPSVDAVVPLDPTGRRQPLAAAYRTARLRDAVALLSPVRGRSMRDLLAHLNVGELALAGADAQLLLDIDTPADLDLARRTVTDIDSPGERTVP